jgi:diaminopimelate decarboxylase
MKAMGLVPSGFGADVEGRLLIGGRAADDLVAEAGGTPLFVYDAGLIQQKIGLFRAAMPPEISLHYAVKANPYAPLLSWIADKVDGFDVASAGELGRVAHLGLPISFAGPGKTDQQLETAIRAAITINLESEGEGERALAIAAQGSRPPKLAVRVNPPFSLKGAGMKMGGLASQFGVDHDRAPAFIRRLIDAGADWRGLHIFAAWQCLDADELIGIHKGTVALGAAIADKLDMQMPELNLGGGFGVAEMAGEQPLDLDRVAGALTETLVNVPDCLAATRIAMELGRWLVADAGVYLTRVIDRKESSGRTFVVTDGGGHHLLGATGCLGEPGLGNRGIAVAGRFHAPAEEEATVTGCLCTPFDVFGDQVPLPPVEVGDLVAIFSAGAYGPTASPLHWESRPLARETLV